MNWIKFTPLYFAISAVVIGAGIFGILRWGLLIGVDFKGGSFFEYKLPKETSTEDITSQIKKQGIEVSSVQKTNDNTYFIKVNNMDNDKRKKLNESFLKDDTKAEELRFENVGPSIGPELVKKTIYATLISAVGILLWVAFQFKSVKFGICAILAMFHDSLVVIGTYSLLGHFWRAEVDFLFVTALLTVLSFSVHDTIVVYDRIREIRKKYGGSIEDIANRAVTETMRRSIFNSLVIVFVLTSLVVFGGSSIRWFATVLLIGTISGTYSSPFTAIPLLVIWERLTRRKE